MHSNVLFMLRKFDATMPSGNGGIRVFIPQIAATVPLLREAGGIKNLTHTSIILNNKKNHLLLINPIINQFNSL